MLLFLIGLSQYAIQRITSISSATSTAVFLNSFPLNTYRKQMVQINVKSSSLCTQWDQLEALTKRIREFSTESKSNYPSINNSLFLSKTLHKVLSFTSSFLYSSQFKVIAHLNNFTALPLENYQKSTKLPRQSRVSTINDRVVNKHWLVPIDSRRVVESQSPQVHSKHRGVVRMGGARSLCSR